MRELSAFDVHQLVNELQFVVGGKVEQWYQLSQKDLYILLYVKDKPKQFLRIDGGKFFFMTSSRPEFPENPMRLCTFLRKHLSSARIESFEQIGFERIIKLTLSSKEGTFDIFAEVFGKGNIVLVKDNTIIAVAEEQQWADRTVKPGIPYIFPERKFNFTSLTESDVNELIKKTTQESIVKTLAIDLGLGGIYAEKAIAFAGIEKSAKSESVDAKQLFLALQKLRKEGAGITNEQIEKEVTAVQPLPKKDVAKEKELAKIRNVIEKQEKTLTDALKEAEESKKKGELIYEKYQELNELLQTIQSADSKDWEKIKKQLKKSPLFKDIKEKEGILMVDL